MVKYRCTGNITDYRFLERFLRTVAPSFREQFGIDIPLVADADLHDSKIESVFHPAKLVYEHRNGLVDPYCGGENWTITVCAENFVSSTGESFGLVLYVTDVAWSHTEVDIRMHGGNAVVMAFASELEPFLREVFKLNQDEPLALEVSVAG